MIDRSVRYQKCKSFFRSLLLDVNYPYKKYFDRFMIVLILISITILMLSKSDKLPAWLTEFDLKVITVVFILEYLLRIWVNFDIHKHIVALSKEKDAPLSEYYFKPLKKQLAYLVSLPALIDLVAIFPKFRIV